MRFCKALWGPIGQTSGRDFAFSLCAELCAESQSSVYVGELHSGYSFAEKFRHRSSDLMGFIRL